MKTKKELQENQNIPELQQLTREVPDGLHDRIMQQIRQMPKETEKTPVKARVLRFPRRAVGAVAAALLLFTCVSVIITVGLSGAAKCGSEYAPASSDLVSESYYASENYGISSGCFSQKNAAQDGIFEESDVYVVFTAENETGTELSLYSDGTFTMGNVCGTWTVSSTNPSEYVLTYIDAYGETATMRITPET